jgi:hypothetical protein
MPLPKKARRQLNEDNKKNNLQTLNSYVMVIMKIEDFISTKDNNTFSSRKDLMYFTPAKSNGIPKLNVGKYKNEISQYSTSNLLSMHAST